MAHKFIDLQKVEELIAIMKANDLVEVEINQGNEKIFLKRSQPQTHTVTAMPIIGPMHAMPMMGGAAGAGAQGQQQAAASAEEEGLVEIKSPMVGTFYARPSPDSDPFVEIGSYAEPQTVVCIIEAMKVMNEIKAEMTGKVAKILVTNGQAVEYGQVLFKVKPE
jgi:acetyl-CoA carboxylase biotin carboxyl carrier protein